MTLDKATKVEDGGSTESLNQTSAAEKLTSQIEAGKQYDGAAVIKAVQDALAADGRGQKTRAETAEAQLKAISDNYEGLKTQFTTVSNQVNEFLRAKNDAELDAVKDDPAKMDVLRTRHANATERIRLERIEADVKAREAKVQTENIRLTAMAAGVDVKDLTDLVPDGNPERLSKAINILKANTPKTPATPTPPVTPGEKPNALTSKPASIVSAGGESRSMARQMLDDAKAKAGLK